MGLDQAFAAAAEDYRPDDSKAKMQSDAGLAEHLRCPKSQNIIKALSGNR